MVAERPLLKFVRSLEGPWRAGVGALLVVLGLWMASQPITSLFFVASYLGATLVVIGMGDLLQARTQRAPEERPASADWMRIGIAVLWVLLGLGTILLPGRAATALPLVLAAALAVSGVLRIVRSRRLGRRGLRTVDERWAAAMLGVAEVVLGLIVLLWPDVTLVVVAVAFGLRAAVVGVQLCWDVLARRRTPVPEEEAGGASPRGTRRLLRVGKVAASAGVLALALAIALASTLTHEPSDHPRFDEALPEGGHPGLLHDTTDFERQVPPDARAWRIQYETVDHDRRPVLATALVVVPESAPLAGGHPVVAWAHGTTGQARQCAPSLLDEPFTAGGFPEVMRDVLDRGWGIVAPDYVGLGESSPGTGNEHAYLVGRVAGSAVLDAVRAARQLDEAALSEDTVVWGHSQGGAAALWTAQVQADYAPDVPLLGAAAMAPASDVSRLAAGLGEVTGGSVFASFVAQGYAVAYDDVHLSDVVRPAAIPLVDQMASRCLTEAGTLASLLTALAIGDEPIMKREALRGPLGDRLAENVPTSLGTAPVLVAQGGADTLIRPDLQGAWVSRVRREATGADPDYRVYDGLNHMSLVQEGSSFLPELLEWTSERFAGQ